MGLGRDGKKGREGVRRGEGGEGTFIVPKIVSPHTFFGPSLSTGIISIWFVVC